MCLLVWIEEIKAEKIKAQQAMKESRQQEHKVTLEKLERDHWALHLATLRKHHTEQYEAEVAFNQGELATLKEQAEETNRVLTGKPFFFPFPLFHVLILL